MDMAFNQAPNRAAGQASGQIAELAASLAPKTDATTVQASASPGAGSVSGSSNTPENLSGATILEGGLNSGPQGLPNSQNADAVTKHEAQAVPQTPDGYVLRFDEGVEVDTEALASFKTLAHGQGLSQAQAASLADLYASLVGKQAESQTAALLETEQGWINAMQQEGNFAEAVANARLAMERFGSDDLKALFNTTRLGSHPALVRFVANVGKALGEPASMRGPGAVPAGLNFYPTMNKD